jgi:hypothetical protein
MSLLKLQNALFALIIFFLIEFDGHEKSLGRRRNWRMANAQLQQLQQQQINKLKSN